MRGKKPTPRALLELGGRVHKKKVQTADFGSITDPDIKNISFKGLAAPEKKRAKQTLEVLIKYAGFPSNSLPHFSHIDFATFTFNSNTIRLQYSSPEITQSYIWITRDDMDEAILSMD